MLKLLFVTGCLVSWAAWAAPRLAVHPLEVVNTSNTQRDQLSAQFEVMLARQQGIKLAGSIRMYEVLQNSVATRCEVRDSCLRFLAEATDSLYGVYVRLEAQPDELVVSGRVVRVDGVLVRKVTVPVKVRLNLSVVELGREALTLALAELQLSALSSTIPDAVQPPVDPTVALTPPPTPAAAPAEPIQSEAFVSPPPLLISREKETPWTKVAGWSLVAVGGAAFGVGAVFGGMAVVGMGANPPDASGLVAPERAAPVAAALGQSKIAAVLLPTGAVLAAVGVGLVVLPSPRGTRVGVSIAPGREGLLVSLTGRFE